MTDIFEQKIVCNKCNVQMKPTVVNKQGFELRAVECPKCHEKIIHPADLNSINHYNDLKGKTFNVKLRMVGNSHAISIPKEIIDFMNEQHRAMSRDMDEMVKLCFEDFGSLRLDFFDDDFNDEDEAENDNEIEIRGKNERRELRKDNIHNLALRRLRRSR